MTHTDQLAGIGIDRASRDRDDREREPLWRRMLSLAFTIAVVAFVAYLWPAMLGGSTRLVIVSGHSMEPTYDLRDIVVVRDSGDTRIGDVVVFEVPQGEAEGMLVIHRVLDLDDEGFFITQGDNRRTPDQWRLTEDDIVGKPLAHIRNAGAALGVIQNGWVIALLVGLIALCVLWPDELDELDELDDVDDVDDAEAVVDASTGSTDDTDALDREAIWTLVGSPIADALAESWLDDVLGEPVIGAGIGASIDDQVLAEAMIWLDEQLHGVEHFV